MLLCADASHAELERAATRLYDYLSAPLVLDAGAESTMLPSGIALPASLAADCTRDGVRTAAFLRGVRDALLELATRFPEQRIEVLYAGTGPLAPLLIPLLPRFAHLPLHVTLLDIHEDAVEAAKIVAEHCGVSQFVHAFIAGDATLYEHPRPLHLLITETMQRALSREPQVSIVRQLAPQLVPDGVMVPESVRVELAIGELTYLVMDLRADSPLDEVRVTLPDVLPPNAQAMLRTIIQTHGEHVIRAYESGLTQPEMLWDLAVRPGETLLFRYRTGPDPRFVWERASG